MSVTNFRYVADEYMKIAKRDSQVPVFAFAWGAGRVAVMPMYEFCHLFRNHGCD